MSTGINHTALLSVGVIAAAIVAVICLRCCADKPAAPVISPQEAASDGYASGYWDGSKSYNWHTSYKDSLYRLAGVLEQYANAYRDGYNKGAAVYNELAAREILILGNLYHEGYELGFKDGKNSSLRDFLKNPYKFDTSVEGASRSFYNGYSEGRKAGLAIYQQQEDEYFRQKREREAMEQQSKPDSTSSLPQGYRDGYDDGYDDGCDNDYKDSWNPRSKERQYLADYNQGYNEGFESGRLDYIEDYYLEGDYEEDWW